jgi:hypothetical protein
MMRTPDSLSMCSKPLICWQRFDQVDFGSRPWILPDPAGQRDGAVAGRQIAIQRTKAPGR